MPGLAILASGSVRDLVLKMASGCSACQDQLRLPRDPVSNTAILNPWVKVYYCESVYRFASFSCIGKLPRGEVCKIFVLFTLAWVCFFEVKCCYVALVGLEFQGHPFASHCFRRAHTSDFMSCFSWLILMRFLWRSGCPHTTYSILYKRVTWIEFPWIGDSALHSSIYLIFRALMEQNDFAQTRDTEWKKSPWK